MNGRGNKEEMERGIGKKGEESALNSDNSDDEEIA